MKKIVLLAAVAVACAANAAQFAWMNSEYIGNQSGSSDVETGTGYLFDTATKSQDQLWAALCGGATLGSFASSALNVGTLVDGDYDSGTATGTTLDAGALKWDAPAGYTVSSSYTLYQVIQVGDAVYFSEEITQSLLNNGTTKYYFENNGSTSAATVRDDTSGIGSIASTGGWYKWNGTVAPTPEPTSGVLMLLGMGLLGLRRKRREA